MMNNLREKKVGIDTNGAILLGSYVCCDAHANNYPLRVVSHVHSDHILALNKSIKSAKYVVATPPSFELLKILKPKLQITNMKVLDYRQPYLFSDVKLMFYEADHIIGAVQTLVELSDDATRILYTGDFKLPKTPIIDADIIVMEATYGNPAHVRPFRDAVETEYVKLVNKSLQDIGVVYIFGYHGKLQEAVTILRKYGIDTPVIMPETVYKVTQVCEKYQSGTANSFGTYIKSQTDEAREIIRTHHYIGVYHVGAEKYVGKNAVKIFLSGWEFKAPVVRESGQERNEYTVALSDHADFQQLLEYVENSKPKLVITDNYRVGDAPALAKAIRTKLGIDARAEP